MMRSTKRNFFAGFAMVVACGLLVLSWNANANAQGQKSRTVFNAGTAVSQQPLYSEYKGVRIGMTAEEARAKLGQPALKDNEQDYYIFSDKETAQIAYDAAHKVVTISTDYVNGIGAPDYRAVVGTNLETREDGSFYKLVRYESLGFWVSYNRSPGPVIIVTVTIQKTLSL
jgi:outer membrane protein assembly factor BamE (lipoprotein component of BamABCDE complex)